MTDTPREKVQELRDSGGANTKRVEKQIETNETQRERGQRKATDKTPKEPNVSAVTLWHH